MQANDPEVFKRRKIDLGMIQFNGPVAMYNLWEFHNIEICLMFTGAEKKSVSNCTNKGEVLKSIHNVTMLCSIEQNQQNRRAVL